MLRRYQLEGLNWLITSWHERRNVILADEMDLGKTIQTLSFLNHLVASRRIRGPFLEVAPLSTIVQWKRMIDEWTNMNAIIYHDSVGSNGR